MKRKRETLKEMNARMLGEVMERVHKDVWSQGALVVLKALEVSCRDIYGDRPRTKVADAISQQIRDESAEFCKDVAERIGRLYQQIMEDWGDRLPQMAHGDVLAFGRRQLQLEAERASAVQG